MVFILENGVIYISGLGPCYNTGHIEIWLELEIYLL